MTSVAAGGEGRALMSEVSCPVATTIARLQHDPANHSCASLILAAKISDWSAYPSSEIARLIQAIGDSDVVELGASIEPYLNLDSRIPDQRQLMRRAVRAICRLAPPNGIDILSLVASDPSEEVLATLAAGLGRLEDPRSTDLILPLSYHSNPRVRHRAISSLAKRCHADGRNVSWEQSTSFDDDVRRAAVSWLAACGGREGIAALSVAAADGDPLTRTHALRGLRRLESGAACSLCDELVAADSVTARETAIEYCDRCFPDEQ